MPICWSIEPTLRCTVITVSDPYTFQQWEAAFADMVAARACEPWRTFLVDRRNATPPTSEFVRMMVSLFTGHSAVNGDTRVAVVVDSDAGFGMGRMAQLTAEANSSAISMRVFRCYDTAQRWLGSAQLLTSNS